MKVEIEIPNNCMSNGRYLGSVHGMCYAGYNSFMFLSI
jgi:hypothetical protein